MRLRRLLCSMAGVPTEQSVPQRSQSATGRTWAPAAETEPLGQWRRRLPPVACPACPPPAPGPPTVPGFPPIWDLLPHSTRNVEVQIVLHFSYSKHIFGKFRLVEMCKPYINSVHSMTLFHFSCVDIDVVYLIMQGLFIDSQL